MQACVMARLKSGRAPVAQILLPDDDERVIDGLDKFSSTKQGAPKEPRCFATLCRHSAKYESPGFQVYRVDR